MGLRKNQRDLTAAEWDRLARALEAAKDKGIVERYATIHHHHFEMGIHRTSHFLPWHREFILRFERELQRTQPEVTLPYWDSSVDQGPGAPLWSRGALGQFDGAWKLRRTFGAAGDPLPSRSTVESVFRRATYGSFWFDLERFVHNPPHTWVGGKMAAMDSPWDPVFYLHHAWIDLLWFQWQQRYPGAAFESSRPGAGLHDPLMEYPDRTPAHVLDHHVLDYAYDVEPPPTGPSPHGSRMRPGEVLAVDGAVRSDDGRYTLVYQGDGNLVLYGPVGALWASDTAGRPVGATVMQTDGNLVIRGPGAVYVWDSATDLNPGSSLVVQTDGNTVIYRPDGGAIWATGTQIPVGPRGRGDTLRPGDVLEPGGSVTSRDGRTTLVYQSDGNLVLYGPGGALWASGTHGSPVGAAIMQPDGNLVVYGPGHHAVWDSSTDRNPGSRLVVQSDGNAVVYRPDGAAVWATNTSVPREPGGVFDADYYLATYPDLMTAFGLDYGAARHHFDTQGLPVEGRRGSPTFDVRYYLDLYADLRAAFGTDYAAALRHWQQAGIREGRRGAP